ncbi:hypothetical protein N875_01105 [Neisseria meningitidis LNP21362]|nr:hypothetical protein N875_01105 [Neisseria meningitidis LNP21362]
MPVAVYAFHPADAVAAPGKFERAYGFERHTHTAFNFRAEVVQAHILNGVAGAGVFAVAAVAEVALRGYHRFGGLQRVFRRHETQFQ